MKRITLSGVVMEIETTQFGNNGNLTSKKLKLLHLAENQKGKDEYYEVEFNGNYVSQIPSNIDLKGATVMILGSLSSIESKNNGKPIVFLKGERLSIISYPAFEEEDEYTNDTVAYTLPPVEDEDDLPF